MILSRVLFSRFLSLSCLALSVMPLWAQVAIDGVASPRIMPLGDSITAGYGANVGGYRAELGVRLRAAGYSFSYVGSQNTYNPNGATDLNHEAHSGWKTPELTAIVNGSYSNNQTSANLIISTSNPDVILLMIGTNDMLGSSTTLGADYDALLSSIFSKNQNARVIVFPMIYSSIFSDVQADNVTLGGRDIQYINNQNIVTDREQTGLVHIITRHQQAGRRITFFDGMNTVVTAANCHDQAVLYDGLHPTAATYAAMGAAVLRSLQDVTPGAIAGNVTPTPPSGLTASANSAGANLAWTVNSLNETGFLVEATTDPLMQANITSVTVAAGTNHTSLNGLQANTTYYFRVRAVNGSGSSAPLAPVKVATASGGGSSQAAPTVTLNALGTGTVNSAVALSATAADSDGSIAKVEFFIGGTLLETDTSFPYAASWTPSVAGSYAVTAKATDNLGASTVSAVQTVVISAANPGPGPGAGTGITGTYFSDMTLTNAVVTRTDATLNFDWGNGSPASGVGMDNFSARWTGQVQAQFSETYTFTTLSDDGVRLWVNGQLLVDNWTDHAPIENSGTVPLVAGQKYDVKMEYFENSGGAAAKLFWASSSTAKQIIPVTQLFPSGTTPDTTGALPSGWTAQDVGDVAAGGSTTQNNGTWTVTGSGADIWNNADGFRFASQRITGDVQVTAQVNSLTNTDMWAKAGVMIRESLANGSRHTSTFATASNGFAYQRRLDTNGSSSHTAGPGVSTPYWVRIERVGNVIISSTSPNGTTWTEIRRETVTMNAAVYVGLVVTSHNNGALCTATFTNVQVVGVAAASN